MADTTRHPTPLAGYAWLSIFAALVTIALKAAAWFFTGSVGLLSDAMESVVNLIGAVMALAMLTVAARPADETHMYGHYKAEYFSSGLEGALILLAAASIGFAAVQRLLVPRPLERVGLGIAVSVVAALVNLVVALVLRRAAHRHESVTLEADSHHLLTDVLTTAGVLIGIGLVVWTGWTRLDPIIGLGVALVIVLTGVRIVRKSVFGLMDSALPVSEQEALRAVLDRYTQEEGVEFHALRTRQSGKRRFVSVHVLVPGQWTVHDGHELLEHIEADVRDTLPNVSILTHLESLDDPASYDDVTLERPNAERRVRERRKDG
ncbi:MAG TPA: cation diffusion facilitator family transporter [Candidatus Krumholzibacteria bacterium]|nr:cation diffusion facilitator family transporter [Candidatus Krumholzibacteria bacterium]